MNFPVPPRQPWSLTARWVFPVDQPPLPDGTVTIHEDRIAAVESHGVRTADLDLGNTALLPGLVNAHTHLDLGGLRGRAPPSPDFIGWSRSVIQHRRTRSAEQTQADIQAGIAECLRYGTTLVGDIASAGASWEALATAPLSALVYFELLGLPRDRCVQALQAAEAWLTTHPATPTCRPGLSPHAPYSVAVTGYSTLRSRFGAFPLATHLAETMAEEQLLLTRAGPFADFLKELGVWAPDQLARDWPEIVQLTAGASPAAYIHANYLDPRLSIPSGCTVVHCPRTHEAFGHPLHPFPQLLARGVRVALGTDSLASNPDLDVLAEARLVHARYPQVPSSVILRMATLSGAEALGWSADTGSLTAGKTADLVVLPLSDEDPQDPHDLVFNSTVPVRAVLWRGRWRWR
jgi:cytosine/adenosine deaminase-related metal-dependent hydrolase